MTGTSRRKFLAYISALLAAPLVAEAQPAGKVARIGLLATTPPPPYMWAALVEGLRGRGWVEGRTILFEQRFSEGRAERFADLAAELVRLKMDVIVTSGRKPRPRSRGWLSSSIPAIRPTHWP
jgi:putative ABC transport system substrate-binding protein